MKGSANKWAFTGLLALLVMLSGCGVPGTRSWVCGPILLRGEERTILFGYSRILDTATIGFREYRDIAPNTHRVEAMGDHIVVERFQQTAGLDENGEVRYWNNLFGYRMDLKGLVLVEYRFRLGEVGDGTREAQLARRLAQGPLAPDSERRWVPCRREPAVKAWFARIVGMIARI